MSLSKHINTMVFTIGLLNCTIGPFLYFITGRPAILIGVFIEMALLVVPLVLNRLKFHDPAAFAVYLILVAATSYFGSILGKFVESQLMVTCLIGISLLIFSRVPMRIIGVLVAFLVLIFLEQNLKYGFIKPIEIPEKMQIITRWAAYVAIISLFVVTINSYWKNDRELRLELQNNARQIKATLEKEEKENRSKDKFLSNASHEMNVSFHSIFSIINNLYKVESILRSQPLKRSLNDLRTACKIAKGIIDNAFGYEKYKAGLTSINRENRFDPRLLFTSTVEVFQYLADENNIGIECRISEDTPLYILSDDVKIRHILTNLLHNAIKFSPNDSTILVGVIATDDILTFFVEDQGEGIPAHDGDIFEPFKTRNPDGLGLGLFIVKELTTSMYGSVEVISSPQGSRFTVSLPFKQAEHHEKILP